MDSNNSEGNGTYTNFKPEAPRPKSHRLLSVLMIVVLLAGIGSGVWYYQQRSIDRLERNVAELSTEKNQINSELQALKKEIEDQKKNKIEVSYSDVIQDTDPRYGSSGGQDNGNAGVIIVRFSAENKGAATYKLSATDFDLKTKDGAAVAGYADTPELANLVKAFGLPDGLTVFNDYNLKVGEKLTGSLVFWNTDKNNTDFMISYNSKSTDLKVTKTTRVCVREGTNCN